MLSRWGEVLGTAAVALRRPVVLVVEDEPLIRMNTADLCEASGFAVIEASNADEALLRIDEELTIRLLVSDIDMPGSLDGLQLAWRLHNASPRTGIILVSGKTVVPADDLPAGAVFFTKPVQDADLTGAMLALAGVE